MVRDRRRQLVLLRTQRISRVLSSWRSSPSGGLSERAWCTLHDSALERMMACLHRAISSSAALRHWLSKAFARLAAWPLLPAHPPHDRSSTADASHAACLSARHRTSTSADLAPCAPTVESKRSPPTQPHVSPSTSPRPVSLQLLCVAPSQVPPPTAECLASLRSVSVDVINSIAITWELSLREKMCDSRLFHLPVRRTCCRAT